MRDLGRRGSDWLNVVVLQLSTGAFAFAALVTCPHMIGDVECALGAFTNPHLHATPLAHVALHHWAPLFVLGLALGHALPVVIFCVRRRAQLRVQLQASLLETMLIACLWLTVVSERTMVFH